MKGSKNGLVASPSCVTRLLMIPTMRKISRMLELQEWSTVGAGIFIQLHLQSLLTFVAETKQLLRFWADRVVQFALMSCF